MLELYSDEIDEFCIDVKVENPKLEEESYISYELIIETNNISFNKKKSSVRRRYSEFVALCKLISKEFPALKTPHLPPKYPFKNHFHPTFIEERRKCLENFIKKLVSQKMYLSSKALHLFLQSNHTMPEIKKIIYTTQIPESFDCSNIGHRFPTHHSMGSLSDENSINSYPSHAELDASASIFPDHDSCAVVSVTSQRCNDSPVGSKKVSFCDQVIIAEVLVD